MFNALHFRLCLHKYKKYGSDISNLHGLLQQRNQCLYHYI